MKKLILTLFLIVTATFLKAQTNYYSNEAGTITGSGYTYKYENLGTGYIIVYNIENRLTHAKLEMKDGSSVPLDVHRGYTELFEREAWSRPKALSIVQNAMNSLAIAQKSLVNGKKLSITMIIDDITGKISEVEFKFFDNGPFRYVPVEVYRKIELDLKNEIWFILTPEGKKLNFVGIVWDQTIKFVDDPEEDLILEPVGPPPPKKPKA